jgi:hypothetical protein
LETPLLLMMMPDHGELLAAAPASLPLPVDEKMVAA